MPVDTGTASAPATRRDGPPSPPTSYRPDIDGLRAIAVSAVLLFHLFPKVLAGGFVGVDIFFVISGYLITGILLKEQVFSIARFYVRRVKRIFPALFVVLAACLLAGWFLLIPEEYRLLGKHIAAGALFSSNIALFRESGYFDTGASTKPLLHLWSLGVEEQYYLVWPLVVAVLRRRPRSVVPALAVLAFASAICNLWLTATSPSAAFFLPFGRFWELSAGGILAAVQWQRGRPASHGRAGEFLATSGIALLVTALFCIDEGKAFPGAWAALPVAGAAALIAGGSATWVARNILSHRTMVWLGMISYPLYLWHWPLLALTRSVAGEELPAVVAVPIGALAIALAHVTWRWLEVPLRGQPRLGSVPALSGAVCAVAVAGLGVFWAGGVATRAPGLTSFAYNSNRNCPPALASIKPPLDVCVVSQSRPPEVAVIGDSHAAHLFAALEGDSRRSWLLTAHYSCPPVMGIDVAADFPGCRAKSEAVLSYLASGQANSITKVVVSMYSGYAQGTNYAYDHVAGRHGPATTTIDGQLDPAQKAQRLSRGLDEYITALLATGKQVALLLDGPEFPFLPNRCAPGLPVRDALREDLLHATTCSVSREATVRRRAIYLGMVAALRTAHLNLQVIDSMAQLCQGDLCPVVRNGELLYRDSHHLSTAGANLVIAPWLAAGPEKVGPMWPEQPQIR